MHEESSSQDYTIIKVGLTYDLTFACLAVRYLETGDSTYLKEISRTKAAGHLINHARYFNQGVPKASHLELVTHLLSPIETQRQKLDYFKKNLDFAVETIAKADFPQTIAKQYLPDNLELTGSMFFTFGYDIGVGFKNNCSLNLAYFTEHINELKFYAVHELHHAGFLSIKDNFISTITTFNDMALDIEFSVQLEGMGTYAPLEVRTKEGALNVDKDYIALGDPELIESYEKEFFDIYYYFKNNPNGVMTDKDWDIFMPMSSKKRLWYTVGAKMAKAIDERLGRQKLVDLISEPSVSFIHTYLDIK
jgi:hypothetical protein